MKSESEPTELTHHSSGTPARWKVITAFAIIYIIWGSTYLAIRYAVDSIPPFLMAGSRSLVAGLLLYAWAVRGQRNPTWIHWRNAIISGGLMLTVGNGGVTWAELVIPSGVTALMVALVPLWMVVVDWLRPNGIRPRPLVIAGLVVGFVGVAFLAPGQSPGSGSLYGWGMLALMLASLGWAIGSIFSRHASKPKSLLLGVAMQMIAGGGLLLLIALARCEPAGFSPAHITHGSALAWLYLTAMGSLVAFTAYVWLLQVSTPAKVSTSAYVNPLIAVVLGCTIGHEIFSNRLVVAGSLIILAVALIVWSKARNPVR